MLNIKETESKNNVSVCGILKELDIEEKTTGDGRDYVSCKATIKVDQEINGLMVENEIPMKEVWVTTRRVKSKRYQEDFKNEKFYFRNR